VRTKSLTKGTIIQIDATPFRQWYENHYGVQLGKKKAKEGETEQKKSQSKKVLKTIAKRRKEGGELPQNMVEQFSSGRLYASISSRPGQSGQCDGYVLEGKELEFYVKKLKK